MPINLDFLAYAVLVVPIWLAYIASRNKAEARHLTIQDEAREAGLVEPNSLHPVVDITQCIGCAACVRACPEGDVLGLIAGKATLIDPTRCIGHGACQKACPVGAIDLVFGTATRGVDIPLVGQDFQTNVPGIYLAGEIGGMGLIRNAINQGVQAATAVAAGHRRDPRPAIEGRLDLLIVGAGPAGLAASLAAMERGLTFECVEQGELGGTVTHYPRHKLVMTEPAVFPLYGKIGGLVMSKEQLLRIWKDLVAKTGLNVRCDEQVLAIESEAGGFSVRTTKGQYATRSVLLAIGRRGTPRKLGVPGEDLPKVVYRLIEPSQYADRRVLVVGGGDAAVETAVALAETAGTDVALAYRRGSFVRTRRHNRELIQGLAEAGKVKLFLNATVEAIRPQEVVMDVAGSRVPLPNDHVVVCAGGVLPSSFLANIGIRIERHFGRNRAVEIIAEAA
jgi:thioredoxin reductase (NADPH)